jgi:hypothetical protein
MCNLLCTYRIARKQLGKVERKEFSFPFSPWVNEQLICVYSFLKRAVTNGAHPNDT